MMINKIVLAFIFLLLNTKVFSQATTYSLPDVWQQVLQHYPSIEAKKQDIQAQELKKQLVRQGFMPEVNIQAQQTYGSVQNQPVSVFPLSGLYTINGGNKTSIQTTGASFSSSAVMQWNLLQFGRQEKKLAAEDAALKVAYALLKQEEWNLVTEATRLYFSALGSMAALSVVNADTQRLIILMELLRSQANAGLRPGADTLLLKASLLQSISKQHDYVAAVNTNLTRLAALMGKGNAPITLDTSIFKRFQPSALKTTELLQSHPLLKVMNARIDAAIAGKELLKKEPLPSVGLLAGAGLKGSGISSDGISNTGFATPFRTVSGTWLAGLGLTWNLASLYQNKTKKAVADRMIASARADKETMQLQLQAHYTAALTAWQEQRQKLLAAHDALAASREAYNMYEVRYQSGLLSLIELLQLQKTLQETEINYVTAVGSYWLELLSQAESLGDPSLILTVIKP